MSSTTKEWLTVIIFFLGFFIFTIGEAVWLKRKASAEIGKSFLFAFSSNILSVSVGFFVSFVIVGVILALAWDGSLQEMPGPDAGIWAALLTAAFFPPVLLTLCKRLLLYLIKLDGVTRPWMFSLITAFSFFMVIVSVPVLFLYLF